MSTQRPHIEANLPGVISTQNLVKSWMRWALFFFFAASFFGLMMRYYFLGEIPFFAYKNLLHTHSHIALLGWGYMLIMGYYVFSFGSDQKRVGLYKKMLTINVVAGLGMLVSFPIQGYGAVSIFFSTIQLLSSYYFSVPNTTRSQASSIHRGSPHDTVQHLLDVAVDIGAFGNRSRERTPMVAKSIPYTS
jgi:hypothetical protein